MPAAQVASEVEQLGFEFEAAGIGLPTTRLRRTAVGTDRPSLEPGNRTLGMVQPLAAYLGTRTPTYRRCVPRRRPT